MKLHLRVYRKSMRFESKECLAKVVYDLTEHAVCNLVSSFCNLLVFLNSSLYKIREQIFVLVLGCDESHTV